MILWDRTRVEVSLQQGVLSAHCRVISVSEDECRAPAVRLLISEYSHRSEPHYTHTFLLHQNCTCTLNMFHTGDLFGLSHWGIISVVIPSLLNWKLYFRPISRGCNVYLCTNRLYMWEFCRGLIIHIDITSQSNWRWNQQAFSILKWISSNSYRCIAKSLAIHNKTSEHDHCQILY